MLLHHVVWTTLLLLHNLFVIWTNRPNWNVPSDVSEFMLGTNKMREKKLSEKICAVCAEIDVTGVFKLVIVTEFAFPAL